VLYRDDKALAQQLLSALLPITKIKDRGVKMRNDLAVLKFDGLAAQIEFGFIANDFDRNQLLDTQVRESVVRTIAQVVIAYLKPV